jgi:hypothetical protein
MYTFSFWDVFLFFLGYLPFLFWQVQSSVRLFSLAPELSDSCKHLRGRGRHGDQWNSFQKGTERGRAKCDASLPNINFNRF